MFCSLVTGIHGSVSATGRIGVMGVYISVNAMCDMGAACCSVLGGLACSVAMKETVKLEK